MSSQPSLFDAPYLAEIAAARARFAPTLYERIAALGSQRAAWETLRQANICVETASRFYAAVRKSGMDGALDALLRLSRETGDLPLQAALSTVHDVIKAGVPEHRRDFNRF